jgi:hypothetical protein
MVAGVCGEGLGPTGLAFLAWDFATKHGNLPLLGALVATGIRLAPSASVASNE